MKKHLLLPTLVLFALSTNSLAEGITGNVSGPGGSGTVTISSDGQIHVTKNFTSFDYLDLTITIPANTTPDYYYGETITNSTGFAWDDFHFRLITAAPPASFIDVTVYSPKFKVGGDMLSVDLTGGVVPVAGILDISVGANIVDPQRLGYTYTIREIPSVPEQKTYALALVGMGVIALSLRTRRAN